MSFVTFVTAGVLTECAMAWFDHAPKWFTRRSFTKPERRQRRMEERRLLKREQDPDETPAPPRTGRHQAAWAYW